MPENPFTNIPKISETSHEANVEVVKGLLGKEEAKQYSELEILEKKKDNFLLKEEKNAVLKEELATPPHLLDQELKALNCPASLSASFEGGVIQVNIEPEILQDLQSYRKAINRYEQTLPSTWVYNRLKNVLWKSPVSENFDVLVLDHGNTTWEEREAFVSLMDKLGYRPLSLSELVAFSLLNPKFGKEGQHFVTYEMHEMDDVFDKDYEGDIRVPYIEFDHSTHILSAADEVGEEWDENYHFLFTQK